MRAGWIFAFAVAVVLQFAEAKAEELRANAYAEEQENVAKVQESKAKVVLAEAEVPKAMAEAFLGSSKGALHI